jgi:thiol-disulfide isomerase/thioredoxin
VNVHSPSNWPSHRRPRPPCLALAVLAIATQLAAQVAPAATAPDRPPRTHALLLNGGGSAARSFLSHLHHLQDMVAALERRGIGRDRIHVFSADGQDPGDDLAARKPQPAGFWLVDRTAVGRALSRTELTSTVWEGVELRPARLGELRRWFASMRDELAPGDTLLVFVTDHGTRNDEDPDNGFISLWSEDLSVLEYRALLAHLRPGVRVVSIMSQCYSGAFADAMAPLHGALPSGDVCGFHSTTRGRKAYGCYPEGRDRDRIGHAFRFTGAMARHASLLDVHHEVVETDLSPDVPLRTSDLFLEHYLEAEAARREVELAGLVDGALARAWGERGRWEGSIRQLDRLGEVYGIFSPRTLGELGPRLDELQALSDELERYEDLWQAALDDLRQDNLDRFLAEEGEWKERLEQSKLDGLSVDEKGELLADLLPAIAAFSRGRAEEWTRLEELRATHEEAKSARYRVDVRLAALLRMRFLLYRIAALQLLGEVGDGGDGAVGRAAGRGGEMADAVRVREALAGLERCEATSPGTFDPGPEPAGQVAEALPPFALDLEVVKRVLPSWLGIRFGELEQDERDGLKVGAGAVRVREVLPDSPALSAGIRPGDIVVGQPGRPFAEPRQVREWTMTSPRDRPSSLEVLRDAERLELKVTLAAYPTRMPELPAPPKAGDPAPSLATLQLLRTGDGGPPDLAPGRRLLFFFATWCGPCKASVPDLLAWGRKTGAPVVAISDESDAAVRAFLDRWGKPFPELVATDPGRACHRSYGVSGTPTFVLVGEDGRIAWRQVGYSRSKGFAPPR